MIELFDHQKKAVALFRNRTRYGFFADPGCGKTIAILAFIDDELSRGQTVKTVVVCPKSVMRVAWLNDAQHFPGIRIVCCWNSSASERRKLIKSNADVLVINPDCFKIHLQDLLMAGVKRLVFDESQAIKNNKSQICKKTIMFADMMQSVYLLSGTPAPNGDVEYWSQLRAIKRGLVPDSFWSFASRWFYPQKMTINGREIIRGWKLKEAERDRFRALVSSAAWSLRKEDCLDLPSQTDEIREFDLVGDEKVVYDATFDQLLKEVETANGVVDCTTNNTLMRLRQIVGGQVRGGPAFGSSKIELLKEVLEEIGNRPVVIWCSFTHEINRVKELLGNEAEIIDGNVLLSQREARINDFQAGKLKYLVCQPQACAHGITLHRASYAIYYSLPMGSWELFKQSRDRLHRIGQHNPVTYIMLIAKDTVEGKNWWALHHKKNNAELMAAILAQDSLAIA